MELSNFGINIEDVISYVAAVRHQSVSKAAQILGLTQPAVTRRIKGLEEDLGVTLLDRNTRPFKPTDIGMVVFEKGLAIVRDIQEIAALVRAQGTQDGHARFGLTQMIAEVVLKPLMKSLHADYPGLNVSVTTRWSSELEDMVGYGELEAAIGVFPQSRQFPENISASMISPMDIVVVAKKGIFPGKRKSYALKDVALHSWILNPEGCGFRSGLQKALTEAGFPLKVAMDGFGMEFQLELVASGLGLGLMPRVFVEASTKADELQHIKLADFNPPTSLWLIHGALPQHLKGAVDLAGKVTASTLHAITSGAG